MQVYQIPKEVLDHEYHGCGKGWAAIKDGMVNAIRYVDDLPVDDADAQGMARNKAQSELVELGKVKFGIFSACEFCVE